MSYSPAMYSYCHVHFQSDKFLPQSLEHRRAVEVRVMALEADILEAPIPLVYPFIDVMTLIEV